MKIQTKLFSLLVLLICSCGNTAEQVVRPAKTRPVNYIVLLDLSDRLLPSQAANDQALIKTVFTQFQKTVFGKGLIINSKDKFRVVIAPQHGVGYNPDNFMNILYLDLESLPLGEKSKQMVAFEKALPETLNSLYATATQRKSRPEHYPGCDLWKYFNDHLENSLVNEADNRLVILTDGYLDFQKTPFKITVKNRSTNTDFIWRFRGKANWEKTMRAGNWGLIPAQVNLPNVSVSVVEINSKFQNLNELSILKTVWSDWLRGMQAQRVTWIPKYSLSNSQRLLQASLSEKALNQSN
ncbi:MAG: hypothetical protein LH606_07445 [Cytophagaceae bacterium]|nr:hypothetical protein [Cytophagaceae bacterium]